MECLVATDQNVFKNVENNNEVRIYVFGYAEAGEVFPWHELKRQGN